MTEPNDREQVRERMAELGRASGRARRERKKAGFIEALKRRVTERPEELVEQLLASPPGAVKAAAILEKLGVFDPRVEEQPRSLQTARPSPASSRRSGSSRPEMAQVRRGWMGTLANLLQA